MAKSIREYKRASLLSPLFVTLEVIMEVIIPLLISYIIDYGINDGNMSMILKIGAALVAAAMVSLLFGAISGHYAAVAASGFAKNLRKDLYYKTQEFSFANIDKFSTSSLVTRLTTDVTNVQNAYMFIIRLLVRGPAMLLFSLFMSFSINVKLSLIFLAAIPVLAVGLFIIIKYAHPVFTRVFKTYDKLNKVVQENLQGIRVVKSFVREDYEEQKFNSVSREIYTDFCKAERIVAFNSPLMQFVVYTCTLLIAWFGAQFIVKGSLTTGELVSLMSYLMLVLMSLMMMSMVFVMVTLARASAERISEVFDETPDMALSEHPANEVKNGDISFENVDFSYIGQKNKLCLKNINLKIKSGQTVGIIGGTGTGKTSLVQLIPRLYDTTSGRITVGGMNVRDYDLVTLRDSVAMVLQKNTLFSGTISENLRWGNENAADEELAHACRLAHADEFIQGFPDGYDTYIEQGGTNVSGGQKQRLCIARALLKSPKILILDDSTSAVDTATDAEIRRAFTEEIPGVTKIIIAQRISSVENSDQIIVMDNGEINAIGTHAELLKNNDIYREVYSSQQKGGSDDAA